MRVADSGASVADVDLPEAEGEVLVRVTLSGICNTDLEIARGYAGFRGTIGHEFVGVIDGTSNRVVGEINAGCGSCVKCLAGDSRHCATRTVLGIVGRDGAHADYLRLPARNLIEVPAEIRDEEAVFVEPLAAACGVLERRPIRPSERVAVIGDGKLGLLCAMVLDAEGHVPLLVGKHPEKLALARACDIETSSIEEARARGRVFDVVVEASGATSGFELALDLLRPQGTLVLKSTFHGTTPLDAARLVVEEVTVLGSRCGRFAPALDLLARRAIDVTPFISEVLSLSKGREGLERAAAPGILKVLLARD